MKKYGGIREVILDLLSDREWHIVEEIEKKCEENEIHLNGDRNPVYGAIHRLKKKELVESNGIGKYRIKIKEAQTTDERENNQKDGEEDKMEESIKNIEMCVEEYKNFDWIHCSDEELRKVRIIISKLINLSEKIQKEFNGRRK